MIANTANCALACWLVALTYRPPRVTDGTVLCFVVPPKNHPGPSAELSTIAV